MARERHLVEVLEDRVLVVDVEHSARAGAAGRDQVEIAVIGVLHPEPATAPSAADDDGEPAPRCGSGGADRPGTAWSPRHCCRRPTKVGAHGEGQRGGEDHHRRHAHQHRLRKRYLRAVTASAVDDSSRRARPAPGVNVVGGSSSASKPEVSSMYSYSPSSPRASSSC